MKYIALGEQAFFKTIGSGVAGTKDTLYEMKRLIKAGAKDPLVIKEARSVIAGVAEKDYRKEVEAVFGYVQNRVRYTKDVAGVETLQTPRKMINDIHMDGSAFGDCDDKTTLLGAMLESIGHETRIIVTSQSPKKNYQHVYLQVLAGDQWIPLDATRKTSYAGWEQPDYTAKAVYEERTGSLKGSGPGGGGWYVPAALAFIAGLFVAKKFR